jgi:DNA-binding HxlR family transcriptional regulator
VTTVHNLQVVAGWQAGYMAAHGTRRSGCPINLTLEMLGDRWSLIVIRDVMFRNRRHYRELMNLSEEGIASNILTDRLRRLVEAGLVSKRDDPTHKQKTIGDPSHSAPR